MANTLLTPSVITKEALMYLHQNLNFIGNIQTTYDDQFAKTGAKIGESLKIRMPNQFTVRSGEVMNAVDVVERTETLAVSTRKGVDMNFTVTDLTMTIDDFSERYIQPAMAVLAANIEADALSMVKDVYNFYDGVGAANTHANIQQGRQKLQEGLAPTPNRCVLHDPTSVTDVMNSTIAYFHDSAALTKQFKEGLLGRAAGMDHFENTLLLPHTTGTSAEGDSGYNINNASTEVADATDIANGYQTITTEAGSATFLQGDIITIDGVYRVHPETKTSTGVLQNFVITTDTGASATTMVISPPIIASGARQNVDAAAANDATINKIGGGNAATWKQALAFQKGAFGFATADLLMPEGVDFAAREVMDGISMRIVRNYDIVNDKLPCRIDVHYGYKTLRAELAARIGHNS